MLLLWIGPVLALVAQIESAKFRFPADPIGPQTVSMGSAAVALARDAEASLNPSGLVEAPRLSLHRYRGYDGYNGFVLAGQARIWRTVHLGLAFRHFDYGKLLQDDLGTGSAGLSANERAYGLTLAGTALSRLRLGAAFSVQVEDYLGSVTSARTFTLGAMMLYSASGRLALSLRGMGGQARNSEFGTEYPLAQRLRVGVAQQFSRSLHSFTVAGDAEWLLGGRGVPDVHLGVELKPLPLLALRTGLEQLDNPNVADARNVRWTAGFGVTVARLELWLGARFGGPEEADELFLGLDGGW